ncbi:hypothetical protein [Micromonospora sp. WMMD1082]|uniref:hypothetical protein n=1 Tax=Micromonospora sp. WMMD1082 TaxID=3016104 RepID=UPI0024176DFF|nr:hypothetical protein [Micromonospora sp. WMMD1082]MDG4796954.1 hypothetical protein [Micromonospora sp. WMMD1082]
MRDGQAVTVRALTAMPGVADGEVRHGVEWGPRLAKLVDAGRYEVLDPEQPTTAVADVDEPPADTETADGVDEERAPARRTRRR